MGALCYKMAKGGFIKSQSVGFIPMEWTNGTGNGEPKRTYSKCELLEISMVVVPANPGATVGLALKSGAIEKSDLRAAFEFSQQFCSDEASPDALAGASGIGTDDAQWRQLMRGLKRVFKRV
jgi:phage head maturation protease